MSCSVVRPGDVFHGSERNATGSVGVVLDLQSSNSLVAVHPNDCGSNEDKCGVRVVGNEVDISPVDLQWTLDQRANYNEWVIRDYEVLGVFADLPIEVSTLIIPDQPADMPAYLRVTETISFEVVALHEVARAFPNLPIYGFKGIDIVRYAGNSATQIEHSQIYRTACAKLLSRFLNACSRTLAGVLPESVHRGGTQSCKDRNGRPSPD